MGRRLKAPHSEQASCALSSPCGCFDKTLAHFDDQLKDGQPLSNRLGSAAEMSPIRISCDIPSENSCFGFGNGGYCTSQVRVGNLNVACWLLSSLLLLLLLLLVSPPLVSCLQEVAASSTGNTTVLLKVGILLEETDHEQANMFIRTIKMINEKRDETIRRLLLNATSNPTAKALPQADLAASPQKRRRQSLQQIVQVKLEPVIEFLADRHSSLEADSKVCQLAESGVRGIVGPVEGDSIQHVQSICDNLEIPYFELRPFLGSPSTPSASSQMSWQQSLVGSPVTNRTAYTDEAPTTNGMQTSGGAKLSGQIRTQVSRLEDLSLNLFPPAHLLNSAYIDLIYALNWTSFAIVYESGSSMIKLQDLFRESSGTWTNKWRIKLFRHDANPSSSPTSTSTNSRAATTMPQVDGNQSGKKQHGQSPSGGDPWKHSVAFRDVFWRVKSSGERNILLDVKTENLYEALKHAQQVGLMTEEYSYLVTSLDLHMIDMEDFKYSRTKITALSVLHISKFNNQTDEQQSKYCSGVDQCLFDEGYLERLGVHVIANGSAANDRDPKNKQQARQGKRVRTFNSEGSSPETSSPAPTPESEDDLARREMLQSSPASMGILPTVDRNNEQKLFEFFVEQQERYLSHVRLSTSSAILHDSLLLYLLALGELDPNGTLLGPGSDAYANADSQTQPSVTCDVNSPPWPHGSSLVNYMRRISFTGLTGPIKFDQDGLRTDFRLKVVGLAPNIRPIKVGEWHSTPASRGRPGDRRGGGGGIDAASLGNNLLAAHVTAPSASPSSDRAKEATYDDLADKYEAELKMYTKMVAEGTQVVVPYSKPIAPVGSLLVNEIIFNRLYKEQADQVDTLIVTSKLSQPYFMLKETPNRLEGNDQFEGFAVDLIHELSKLVNFRYKWRVVADGKYGSKEIHPNGSISWNGMIGEIVRGEADLAIVDLTITAQREEAVDFTLPFMNTGISILFKKPTTKVTTLFSFLSPFSSDVWAYVLAAYCGISAILFFVGHLSPYEWANPHPCRHLSNDGETTVLKNQFSLLNSFWFTIGSLMQQGSDLTPRSMSTRTIAGIWYFFTLIMISSYTANLAAFLTVEKVVYPIENVRDLSQQQEIKYGCVESGSTCTFFHNSHIDTYKRIDETMSKFRTYVRSNDEGQKRVGEGKFAFFMESTTIEYIIERNCNLTQIGGLIDSKGYGLATSKKSRLKRPYRTLLNEGILHLQETGMLHVLKNRWWKERRGGGTCTDDGKGGGVTELSLANVGGVFVVLLGGLGISFLVAIAEFMWRARRSGSSRDRMCEEMMNDLKFALACKSSTKPTGRDGAARGRSTTSRLVYQQDSSNSLGSTSFDNHQPELNQFVHMLTDQDMHDRQQHPNKASKDCDPILMHAMLTILMQQQAEQKQRANGFLAQPNQRRTNYQRQFTSANSSEQEQTPPVGRRQVSEAENQRRARFYPVSTLTSYESRMSNSANMRRLLFAQQSTIDNDTLNEITPAPGATNMFHRQ